MKQFQKDGPKRRRRTRRDQANQHSRWMAWTHFKREREMKLAPTIKTELANS